MSVENTVVRAAGAAPLTVTLYEIDFTLSSDTLTALDSGNYNLYGFKAVQTSQGGGAPLVWFQLAPNHFSTSMTLKWTEQYQAYTSSSEITPGYQITAGYSAPVTLEQTLQVGANGFGPVVGGGDPQAISINNTSFNISRAIGPAIGGFVIAAVSLDVPFWVYVLGNLVVEQRIGLPYAAQHLPLAPLAPLFFLV